MPIDNALTVVCIDARSGIRLERRGARLFHLEEERIFLGSHEQDDGANGSDAPDAHDLDRHVLDLEAIQNCPPSAGPVFPLLQKCIAGTGAYSLPVMLKVKDRRGIVFD